MEVISESTFVYKRVFPMFFFGILALFIVPILGKLQQTSVLEWLFILAPFFIGILGFIVFRRQVWNLADRVEDYGSYLLIRCGNVEERVELTDVAKVSINQWNTPSLLTLRLRKSTVLGDTITFIPVSESPIFQARWRPDPPNEVAESLIRRVGQSQMKGHVSG